MPTKRSAFTLIELLVVIAIVAILAVAVIFTLNPAELLRQARDSNRLSDLDTMRHAIALYQTDVSAAPLGSSTVPYLSIPDSAATTTAGSDCSSLGFLAGISHCAASSTYRLATGSGWIPLNFAAISSGAPFSNLPVDPINTTSSDLYYTYLTDGVNWKVIAAPESQKYQTSAGQGSGVFAAGSSNSLAGNFPTGWVPVPGNPTFGTPTFWVMKYNAKCAAGGVSLTTPATAYQTYDNSGAGACTSAYGRTVASTPDGYPIANVNHVQAAQYCASIGAHLLTNDEYMTIVTNAAAQGTNWFGGTVGTNYLFSGHNDNQPAYALQASGDDTQGYYLETNQGGNQRRTFTLSNGSVVWDFAGNVYQHVTRSINNVGDLTTTMALPACSNSLAGWEWCQYGNSTTPYISTWSPDVSSAKVAPPNTSWNSTQGMGQVYTYGTGVNQGTAVFIRGGSWDFGGNAGAFALGLNWGAGSAYSSVGFRCAR